MGFSNLCVVTVALSDGKGISYVLFRFSAKTFLDYNTLNSIFEESLHNNKHCSSFSPFVMNLHPGSGGRI